MASLRSLVESALKARFERLISGDAFRGLTADTKVLPCIICAATKAVQTHKAATGGGPANYLVQVEIITKDRISDDSQFDDIADAVHYITAADGFAVGLSGSGLVIFGETEPAQIEWLVDGEAWVQTITLTMECALTIQP